LQFHQDGAPLRLGSAGARQLLAESSDFGRVLGRSRRVLGSLTQQCLLDARKSCAHVRELALDGSRDGRWRRGRCQISSVSSSRSAQLRIVRLEGDDLGRQRAQRIHGGRESSQSASQINSLASQSSHIDGNRGERQWIVDQVESGRQGEDEIALGRGHTADR
jgi:hypothetical protein